MFLKTTAERMEPLHILKLRPPSMSFPGEKLNKLTVYRSNMSKEFPAQYHRGFADDDISFFLSQRPICVLRLPSQSHLSGGSRRLRKSIPHNIGLIKSKEYFPFHFSRVGI